MADYEIKSELTLDDIVRSANLCDLMEREDVETIGRCALDGYRQDRQSREEWESRSARALELALQVVDQRTFPWPNASNIKFPLITVAALQYQARAYPALIDGSDLVKCRVYGDDADGSKTARAERVSTHMSWQNLEQDDDWEEEHDKALLVQPIAGCAFIKKTYDPACRHNVTRLVTPKDFVINYWSRDIETSPRYTHVFNLTENDVRQRELDKRFCKPYADEGRADESLAKQQGLDVGPLKAEQDKRQGLSEPQISSATPYLTGEQYCWWDLDGDGYQEPYIVTFDIGTGCVRRIVARFLPSGVKRIGKEVYSIEPVCVFTKMPFIPSPDGGFYDLGLGSLLGPINESVNTALNQIFDAGTMATLGGGFVGRGFKNRGGPFTFRPFEWHPIDAPGDDLRKNVLPLPVREPSNVLFQVLGLLIQYGERVVAATDIQLGESPGQNTPAETTRTLNENGSRVYNAIYKRTWRALREEFRIQYGLNQGYLAESEGYENLTTGVSAMVRRDDYLGPSLDVKPAADPHIVSDTQRVQQATMLVQAAGSLPGFNRYRAGLRWLKAMKIPNIDEIYPQPMAQGPDGKPQPANDFPPPPPDPKMIQAQVAQGELQLKGMEFQADQMKARIQLLDEVQESRAKVQNLQAQAMLYAAQAKSEESEPLIKLIYAEIESEGKRGDRLLALADMVVQAKQKQGEKDAGTGNGRAGMAQLAQPATNAAVLGAAPGLNGGGQGAMGGGQVPIQ